MSLQRGPSLSAREMREIVDRASHQKNASKRPKPVSPGNYSVIVVNRQP